MPLFVFLTARALRRNRDVITCISAVASTDERSNQMKV